MRVATFNIHHGASADDRLDLARTAAEIRALDADVVGLQEVDVAFGERSADEDQARALGEMLGMDVAFAPAIDRPAAAPDGPRRQYGVALLVRGRILDAQTHLLPAGRGLGALREPRVVLCASVSTERGTTERGPAESAHPDLIVLVTHLDKERREHRVAQIGRIIELAARRAQDTIRRCATGPSDGTDGSPSAAIPAVLLGDMNADQSAPELRQLAGEGWRDAALEASGRGARRRAAGGAGISGPGPERSGRGLATALRSPALAGVTTALVSAVANVVSVVASRLPGTGNRSGGRSATRPGRTSGSTQGRRSARGRRGAVRGSFPAVFPVRRIDGIWVHGSLDVRSVEVAPGRASDHRPVVAELRRTDAIACTDAA